MHFLRITFILPLSFILVHAVMTPFGNYPDNCDALFYSYVCPPGYRATCCIAHGLGLICNQPRTSVIFKLTFMRFFDFMLTLMFKVATSPPSRAKLKRICSLDNRVLGRCCRIEASVLNCLLCYSGNPEG